MLQVDCIRVTYHQPRGDGTSRMVAAKLFGPDATPDNAYVDVDGFAARLILADEQRLGRRRARSGAEKILRAAGFGEPGRAYAGAMDRISRDRLAGDDYAWLRETEETSCPDCGAGEHEQDRCAERSTTP